MDSVVSEHRDTVVSVETPQVVTVESVVTVERVDTVVSVVGADTVA